MHDRMLSGSALHIKDPVTATQLQLATSAANVCELLSEIYSPSSTNFNALSALVTAD